MTSRTPFSPRWKARGRAALHQPGSGLGSIIKQLTSSAGIKPCGGCAKRAEALDRLVPLGSRRRIFVSIASYRDPELSPTIADCIAKARWPDRLRFGVCWQHGSDEHTLPFLSDSRFRVLDVPWRESQGACWARAEIMKLWAGEDYYLQIDSHMRFVQDWDAALTGMCQLTESAKPVLSTYCPGYTPGRPPPLGHAPVGLQFGEFAPNGIIGSKPALISHHNVGRPPVRARFVSAHFLFTIGSFIDDVPYDPELYFYGEEITLAVRAFTAGYDLYHPTQTVLFHNYSRESRALHWGDHVAENNVSKQWWERDADSQLRVMSFLKEPHAGSYGCGSARLFSDYEQYAGISFTRRRVQDYTRQNGEPPNPPAPADWIERTRDWHLRITLEQDYLVSSSASDWSFWYVGAHDVHGDELYRLDVNTEELRTIFASTDKSVMVIERDFESTREPATWTVWPVTRDGRWLDPLSGAVDRAPALRRHWQVRVSFLRSQLPEEAYRDCQLWYLGFHAATGGEIARIDVSAEELQQISASDTAVIALERGFDSAQRPATWTVWPVTRDGQWLDRLSDVADAGSALQDFQQHRIS